MRQPMQMQGGMTIQQQQMMQQQQAQQQAAQQQQAQQQRMMQMNLQQQQGNIRMQPMQQRPGMSQLEQRLQQQQAQSQQHGPGQQPGMMMQRGGVMQRMAGPPMPRAPPPGYIRGPSPGLSVSSPALLPQGPSPVPTYAQSPQQMQQPSPGQGMVPSPMGGKQNSSLNPSPSSGVNTPSGAPASQEDREYLEKVKQLEKYIEPLRRMIHKIGNENDQDRLTKMKKLLDILSNPQRRMPLSTLQKCEDVLKRMALDTVEPDPSKDSKESSSSLNPLLEAVINIRKSNSTAHLNHALSSTFLPPCQSFLGSPITLPPLPPSPDVSDDEEDIPNVLQGEIARLEPRFKVTLSPSQPAGDKSCIQLVCQLDDKDLPAVPPINVTILQDYPRVSPQFQDRDFPDYLSTPFLERVNSALSSRLLHLPPRHTLSQLLTAWELSVRSACSPNSGLALASGILSGL